MAESDRIKWDQRYSGDPQSSLTHPVWIEKFDDYIPRHGNGLDIAAGSGRMALWLAARGLTMTAVDISPVGLRLAQRLAEDRGLRVETLAADLEIDPLPNKVFQVITCFRYWQPTLFPAVFDRLESGGVLLAEVATTPNLEKHDHPSSRYLAEPQALREICSPVEILYYTEDWFDDAASARVVARKA